MKPFTRLLISVILVYLTLAPDPGVLLQKRIESRYGPMEIINVAPMTYYLKGEIGIGDCRRFKSRVRTDFTRVGNRLILNSPGGNYKEGLCIADHTHDMMFDTIVADDYYGEIDFEGPVVCASACSYIFAAGRNRTLKGDVFFGIHNPGMSREVIGRVPQTRIEYNTFANAGKLIKSLDKYGIDNMYLRDVFFTVPHDDIFIIHPNKFEEQPYLKGIATKYIDFHGYTDTGEE